MSLDYPAPNKKTPHPCLSFLICFLGQVNLSESEKLNFDAVTKIHSHLDDDENGKVDLSESNEVRI